MGGRSGALRRFNYLMGETGAAYHEAALRLGLSDSAMRILYAVCDCGSGFRCSLRDVCRSSGLSKQTVNSALRKLEREGLAFVEPVGAKSKDVCLTGAGRALAEDTVLRLIAVENAIFGSWPEQDVEQYLALTEKYLAAFRNEIKNLRKHTEQEFKGEP